MPNVTSRVPVWGTYGYHTPLYASFLVSHPGHVPPVEEAADWHDLMRTGVDVALTKTGTALMGRAAEFALLRLHRRSVPTQRAAGGLLMVASTRTRQGAAEFSAAASMYSLVAPALAAASMGTILTSHRY
jgi:hypothetical protein